MKWPASLRPAWLNRRAAERRQQLEAQLEAALARRKAGPTANAERSRKGARTRVNEALRRDPLFSQKGEPAR